MSSYAVLGACLLFILLLFILDIREKGDNRLSIWVPVIWLTIISSRPVAQWFSVTSTSEQSVYLEGNPIDRNILLFLMLIGIFLLIRKKSFVRDLLRNNRNLILWILFCTAAVFWSDFFAVSLKRLFKSLGTYVVAALILSHDRPLESIKTVIIRSSFVTLPMSIVLIKYFRQFGVVYGPWGGSPVMAGVAQNKNSLGRLCLVTGFILFMEVYRNFLGARENRIKNNLLKKCYLVLFFLAVLLLLMSESATSLVTLVIGCFLYVALKHPVVKRNTRNIEVVLVVLLVVFLVLQVGFNFVQQMITGLGRDLTLTDRTLLWSDLLAMKTNPLLGVGYDSFWLGPRMDWLWDKYWWKPNEAHNGYLEIYLELGFVGLGIFFMVLASGYAKIRRLMDVDYDFASIKLAFLAVFLLYNVTEAAVKGITLMWFMLVLFLMHTTFYLQNDTPEKD